MPVIAQPALGPNAVTGQPGASATTDVYVSATGSDLTGNGTITNPWQTLDQVNLWIGQQVLIGTEALTVHLVSATFSVPPSGVFDLASSTICFSGSSPGITYKGTQFDVAGQTGVITVYQSFDASVGHMGIITCPGINFTTHNSSTGHKARVVGGPRDGLRVCINRYNPGETLAANQARTSGGPGAVEPQVGDTLQIYAPTKLDGAVEVGEVFVEDLTLGSTSTDDHMVTVRSAFGAFDRGTEFTACIVYGLDLGSGPGARPLLFVEGCDIWSLRNYGIVYNPEGSTFLRLMQGRDGGSWEWGQNNLCLNLSVVLGSDDGAPIGFDVQKPLIIANYTGTQGLYVGLGCPVFLQDYLAFVDAQVGTAYAMALDVGGLMRYLVKPASFGTAPATAEIAISGIGQSFAALPAAPSSVLAENPSGMGGVFEVRFAIGTSATQSSASNIPANAVVFDAQLDIEVAYSGGTTITVGRSGSLSLLMVAADSDPTTIALYDASQDTSWGGSDLPVVVTVAGAPGAGSGHCIVRYARPAS